MYHILVKDGIIIRYDVIEERYEWGYKQESLEGSRLVFIDECSVNTGMTRQYGRGEKGERVVDYVPDTRYETETIVSSVRLDGETVPLMIDGAMNGEAFKTYLRECLVPTLRENDMVLMDSLSSHKVAGVKEIIEKSNKNRSQIKM